MKHLKNFILIVAIAIIIVLIAATMIERNNGTPYVRQNIYTTSWFVLLWAALATASACYITLYKLYKNINVFIIHISFLVILLGALASWITSESGNIHLRHGESTSMMKNQEGEPVDLGFIVSLKNFKIVSYPGTDAPMDYVTELRAGNEDIKVSMNNIGSYNGYSQATTATCRAQP